MSELCLKENKVLTLRDQGGVPVSIEKIDNKELLPLSIRENCTDETFFKWLERRNMPQNREGLSDVVNVFGNKWMQNINYCSLTDQYWIKRRTESWYKVNFFTRLYKPDVGDLFFKPWNAPQSKRIKNESPDLTTGGVAKKRWIQNDGLRSSLVKAGSTISHQEPLNEVMACAFIEKLGKVKSANYNLYIEGVEMCSICPNFVTETTELVTAADIYNWIPRDKKNNETVLNHLKKACEHFDIPDCEDFLEWMIFIDGVIGNDDRNLGNIGFLRDINTMKFIGPAPLYDCANAYMNKNEDPNAVLSKVFKDSISEIMNKMRKKCELDKLLATDDIEKAVMNYSALSEKRKEQLINNVKTHNRRILHLEKIKDYIRE